MEKILVIDDEKMVVDLLILALEDYYTVWGAASGEEAMEKIPLLKPDIVLLDLSMPVVSGFDVLDWIKQNNIDVRVAIVSAYDSVENKELARIKGAIEWLSKPFDIEDLMHIVMKLNRSITDVIEPN